MTDPNPQSEQNQTPEDVATLYSWANLHGAKYRDFSASRAQTREKARLRAEQALGEEQRNSEEEVKAAQAAKDERVAEQARAAEAARAVEQARLAEAARQAEIEAQQAEQAAAAARRETERLEAARQEAAALAAQKAAQQAALDAAQQKAEQEAARQAQEEAARQQAARLEAEQAARREAEQARERATQLAVQRAREEAAQQAMHDAAMQAQAAKEALAMKQAAERAAEQAAQQQAAQQPPERRGWQPWTDRYAAAAAQPYTPVQPPAQSFESTAPVRLQPARPADAVPRFATAQNDGPAESRGPWASAETREPVGRPAWLSGGNFQAAAAPAPANAPANAPEDTLQGSRDRLTSRWFALRGVFDPSAPPAPEAAPLPVASHAPALAVFSLAGGVGKTSLVATLGRALSARGERVLLVDTAAFGLLPFFFGATDQRPGLLRTFLPPGVAGDAPVQMVTIDPDGVAQEQSNQESLSGEIAKFARGSSRIIVDLATASGSTTRRILHMAPLVLVPVVPDMNSVVSVSSIDAFFEHNSAHNGRTTLPYYVLNQFDATLPLHLDVREVLREQLGERLLPFALRRTPAMSEALAEGMTVIDYAPGSTLAEDFVTLAGWLKSLSAPATASYRGVRWSER
jgi:cellulose synthase operon protein YhjQ